MRYRHFVTSFCSNLDRASAWLNYGKNGTGVGLGFHRQKLRGFDDPELNAENPYWVEIEYDPAKQLSRLFGLVEVGRALLAKHHLDQSPRHASVVAHIVQLWLSAIAVRMKHPSFVGEDEWRLVAWETWLNDAPVAGTLPKHLSFGSLGQIRPFVEFPLPTGSFHDLVLGCSCQADEFHLREALPRALASIPITRSTIPVRPT